MDASPSPHTVRARRSIWTMGGRIVGRIAALAAALLCLGGWERVAEKDGVLVERQHVEGSPLYAVRATTTTALPPEQVIATVWNQRDYPRFVPYLAQLDMLEERPDEHVTYERVHFPVVKDRDYAIRARRVDDPARRVYRIDVEAVPERGPPPARCCVRVTRVAASWVVEPSGDGTRVTYTVATDPAGSIPTWIVNLAQKGAVPKVVRAMLDRAAAAPAPR
jgi:ribosome-associated toxin RatA of RatAB toxin-antitoxin module